jgi:acyl dehydratase
MPSLTPLHRAEEASDESFREGLVNGTLVLAASAGMLALAMKNPNFVLRTNNQSRTALVIMPSLAAFGLTR